MPYRTAALCHLPAFTGFLVALSSAPLGCSSEFHTCKASRTCPEEQAGAGESGAPSTGSATGGSSSGASGASGTPGSSGTTGTSGSSGDGSGDGAGEAGGGGAGGEGGAGDSVPPDAEPPTVVSVSPANGAVRVRSDQDLVVTFSEPMDRDATRDAYESADLPPGAVTFSWNAQGTVLTIHPVAGLPYASGPDASVTAKQFVVVVADSARDAAGNRLSSDYGWSFKTFRRIVQSLPVFDVRSIRRSSSSGFIENLVCAPASVTSAGWVEFNAWVSLVSFDTRALPNEVVQWESAVLEGRLLPGGDPYARLGSLHVHATSLYPTTAALVPPLTTDVGVISNAPVQAETPRSIGVLASLLEHHAHRGARHELLQYELDFDTSALGVEEQSDFSAAFRCSGFGLSVSYLLE